MGTQASSFKEAETFVESPIPEEQIQHIYEETVVKEDTFWKHAKGLPIYSHGITAWKFLYIVHKILWIAPYEFIKKSQSESQTISNVGNSWIVLYNYGQLNNFYGKYLVNILKVYNEIPYHHTRSDISINDLKKIIGSSTSDWVSLFQRILDLQDSNLALQNEILKWMKNLGLDGKTPASQCRVLPIILCLTEANQIRKIQNQILNQFPAVADQVKDGVDRCQKQNKMLQENYEKAKKFQYVSDNLSTCAFGIDVL